MRGLSTALLRAIFAVVFAVTGFLLGREAFLHMLSLHIASETWQIVLTIVVPVLGAVIGVFAAPLAQSLFEVELDQVESAIERLSPGEIVGGAIGLIAGLVIAFLVKSVLFEFLSVTSQAGGYIAIVLYILVSLFFAYLGARVGAKQQFGGLSRLVGGTAPSAGVAKIIDTSVIVDGRILEIAGSGFLEGPLVVPRFVLRELQLIADSVDGMKRTRGRRGLDVLAKLQEIMPIEIADRDYTDLTAVDAKLVRLAKEREGKLVTNDYNLNRVAQVEGVTVLNINELADAVKPVVLPGEELHVAIVRDGKEAHQGVGYLDDGTMIVVENGAPPDRRGHDVQVTSVLQTVAGRMIFAKPKRSSSVGTSRVRWGAAIVAAGRGERFGGPKQLAQIAGRPLIAWSISTLGTMPEILDLAIATEPEYVEMIAALSAESAPRLAARVVAGGATRQESVRAALRACPSAARRSSCTTARARSCSRATFARRWASFARGRRRCSRRASSTRSRSSNRRAGSCCARSTGPNSGPRRRRSARPRPTCGARTATRNGTASSRPTMRRCSNAPGSTSSPCPAAGRTSRSRSPAMRARGGRAGGARTDRRVTGRDPVAGGVRRRRGLACGRARVGGAPRPDRRDRARPAGRGRRALIRSGRGADGFGERFAEVAGSDAIFTTHHAHLAPRPTH